MHLLIVEDEEAIRSALVRGLAASGRTVASAASVAEGRARAAERRPDLLITDLTLPDGRGLDLAAELAGPCVLMTGYATFDDAVAALRLGALDFFTKPVSLRALRQVIERFAGRHGGGPLVVDADLPEARLVGADGIHQVRIGRGRWRNPSEARAAFEALSGNTAQPETRLVLAECLQAIPSGRAVVNVGDGRWSLLVEPDAPMAWPPAVQQVIADCALVASLRPDRGLVECRHG
jgi:DNA-binding response OmpR family regulator